jgi:hypothetical protein
MLSLLKRGRGLGRTIIRNPDIPQGQIEILYVPEPDMRPVTWLLRQPAKKTLN